MQEQEPTPENDLGADSSEQESNEAFGTDLESIRSQIELEVDSSEKAKALQAFNEIKGLSPPSEIASEFTLFSELARKGRYQTIELKPETRKVISEALVEDNAPRDKYFEASGWTERERNQFTETGKTTKLLYYRETRPTKIRNVVEEKHYWVDSQTRQPKIEIWHRFRDYSKYSPPKGFGDYWQKK